MFEIGDQTSMELRVGDRASLAVSVHDSVGKRAECETSDATTLRLESAGLEYANPERMGMPGGDAAARTFVFSAMAPGSATITLRKLFRGTVEETREIKVTVKN